MYRYAMAVLRPAARPQSVGLGPAPAQVDRRSWGAGCRQLGTLTEAILAPHCDLSGSGARTISHLRASAAATPCPPPQPVDLRTAAITIHNDSSQQHASFGKAALTGFQRATNSRPPVTSSAMSVGVTARAT